MQQFLLQRDEYKPLYIWGKHLAHPSLLSHNQSSPITYNNNLCISKSVQGQKSDKEFLDEIGKYQELRVWNNKILGGPCVE